MHRIICTPAERGVEVDLDLIKFIAQFNITCIPPKGRHPIRMRGSDYTYFFMNSLLGGDVTPTQHISVDSLDVDIFIGMPGNSSENIQFY